MRKKLAWTGLVIAAMVVGLVLNTGMSAAMTYNLSPDVSGKMVGSRPYQEIGYSVPINSLEELLSYADLVVIGEVITEGRVAAVEWPKIEGAPDMTAGLPPVAMTHVGIRIKKTLYGEARAETITLLQFGDKTFGETKVKQGQNLVLLLAKTYGGESFYKSVCWEKGYFEISDDSKVISFSDDLVVAKYDNTSLDLLTRDILAEVGKK